MDLYAVELGVSDFLLRIFLVILGLVELMNKTGNIDKCALHVLIEPFPCRTGQCFVAAIHLFA